MTEHRSPSGERASHGVPVVALAVQRADLPELTPAPGSTQTATQGPAALSSNGGHHAYPFLLAAVAVLTTTLSISPAAAQQVCDERADVLGHLAQKYGEVPVAIGVTNTGGLVEVLTDARGDTWTIIVTTPQGMSCLVAEGEGWHVLLPVEKEPMA